MMKVKKSSGRRRERSNAAATQHSPLRFLTLFWFVCKSNWQTLHNSDLGKGQNKAAKFVPATPKVTKPKYMGAKPKKSHEGSQGKPSGAKSRLPMI